MNQRSENSYPNTLNASLDIRRRSSFICKFVAPSAKSRHSSSPTALAPNFYPSSEVWGHGQQAYACSRSAVVASAVAPISCSQSLFVIVAAVVPMPARALPLHGAAPLSPLPCFGSVRPPPPRSFFCFFPVFPSVAFGRRVVSDASHPSLALSPKSRSFVRVRCSLARPPEAKHHRPRVFAVNSFHQCMQLCMKS